MRLLVTGGCGFIGSNFIRYVLEHYQPESVTNVDLLTYAGSLVTTADFPLRFGDRYEFIRADIADREAIQQIISRHSYFAVINFAAESHVDQSIVSPADFYGSNESAIPSTEAAGLNPSSPYSASKAAADLLALAYHKTYGLDVVIIRGSNNYGPYQFPEKLIPLLTIRAMLDEPLRIYGDGLQVRDWIHVEDFCAAVFDVLMEGHAGAIYNVANGTQLQNLTVAKKVLQYLRKSEDLIRFVQDRSAHDRKYSLDSTKIRQQIGWKPLRDFEDGLGATIDWYRNNEPWWRDALQPRRVS